MKESVGRLACGAVLAALMGAPATASRQSGSARLPESHWLERAAAAPDQPLPRIDLAKFYYETRALAGAESAVAVAAAHVHAARTRQAAELPTAAPPPLPRVGIEVPEPTRTRNVAARYPQEALKHAVFGVVVIDAVIDREGRVRVSKVRRSIPPLDRAATEAVRQWRFTPVTHKGAATEAAVVLAVNFTLRRDPQVLDELELAALYCTIDQWAFAEDALTRARRTIQEERKWLGDGPSELPRARNAANPDGTVTEPVKIKDVKPEYPPAAIAARVSGRVQIETVIQADGTVGYARYLSAPSVFDREALDAVRQWRFRPTLLDGKPVAVVMTVTVTFAVDQNPGTGG